MPTLTPRAVFHPRGVDSKTAARFGWQPVTRIGPSVYIERLSGITIPSPGRPHVPATLLEQTRAVAEKLADICRRTGLSPDNLRDITIRVRPKADLEALSRAYRVLYDFFGEKVDEADWRIERFAGPPNELIQLDATGCIAEGCVEDELECRLAA